MNDIIIAEPKVQLIPALTPIHYAVHVSIDYLEGWIENHEELDLDPDFQREHVWTPEQQRRFVEFFLRDGQSGRDLYFNHPGWGTDWKGAMVIVDGKQRLEAVRAFLRDEIGIFGGWKYSQFPTFRVHQAFYVHVARLKTRAEVLQWYLDLNTGGTDHTPAELERVAELLEAESAPRKDPDHT